MSQLFLAVARRLLRMYRCACRWWGVCYILVCRPGWRRYLRPWFASRHSDRTALADEVPWVTYPAIEWLQRFVRPEMSVFEWGSGGSTLFFAARVRSIVSVEHHAEWFDRVSRLLQSRGIANVEFRLIGPDDTPPPQDRTDPNGVDYRSRSRGYKNAQFVSYARSIDDYPDGTFDLVLVDGRARMACLAHAIPKVSPGGALLLDNAEYRRYRPVLRRLRESSLSTWEHLNLSGPGPYSRFACSCTLVWIRPPQAPR